jgi:hypothetical protein
MHRGSRPGLNFLNSTARELQRKKKIGRSTPLIGEIVKITDITASNPQIRKRRGIFGVRTTQRSGVRSIAPWDMIWKSARLLWIARRCRRQQYWCPKKPVGLSSARLILTVMNRWERSL